MENKHFFCILAPEVKNELLRTLSPFGSIWAHLPPPPRGAAWAVDGWLGEDGEGGAKGWLGSQRCQIGGAQASAKWIWCQRAGGRSSSLLSPQGAYW